jgi:hypothetical protein
MNSFDIFTKHSTTLTGLNNRMACLLIGVVNDEKFTFDVIDTLLLQKYNVTVLINRLADQDISVKWLAPNRVLCQPYDKSIERIIVNLIAIHIKNMFIPS